MRVTAAKDGVQGRRRLRIFAAAAALVLLCAVCVGGVSGEVIEVSTEQGLREAITKANGNGEADTIILLNDITLVYDRGSRGGLPTPLKITSDITITNVAGTDVTLKTSYTPSLTSRDFSIWNYDTIDAHTLFHVNSGKLTVGGNADGGSITITTNQNGRAFDVNEDGGRSGAVLEINGGVHVYRCGFSSEAVAESNNGGAIYVRNYGTFIMNGGMLSENRAGAGGAVYIDGGGKFEMNGGAITLNFALNTGGSHDKWGGGVWRDSYSGVFTWKGGEINGNTASSAPAGDLNYHEVWPEYNPPTAPESPVTPNYPIYVVSSGGTKYDGYETIKEAYNDASSKHDEFTIYIKRDFTQTYIEDKVNGGFTTTLDAVTIEKGKTVTLKPDTSSLTLHLINRMFTVSSGGVFIISGNGASASLTVSGTLADGSVDTGGFVLVDGGSFTLQDGVTISSAKAKNGGAVYLKSGFCTLSGGSITGCSASEMGSAVYVASGTLTVSDDFTLPATNDVYLADGQVITLSNNYDGTIGKITLSDYSEGRNVIDISANTAVSPAKFVLNPADASEYEDLILMVSDSENGKTYLELGVDVQFTILIPAALELDGDTYTGSMKITAEKVLIPTDDVLRVTVTSPDDGFILLHYRDAGITLPYTLSVGSPDTPLGADGEIARFTKAAYQEKQAQNAELAVDLYAKVSAEPRYAGDYKDTLTFTVTYIEG